LRLGDVQVFSSETPEKIAGLIVQELGATRPDQS
jgi:hypothetical protein